MIKYFTNIKIQSIFCLLISTIFSTGNSQSIEEAYFKLISSIETQQEKNRFDFINSSFEEKGKIVLKARGYLIDVLANEIFPYWYGTPWDFYGQTEVPGKGKIACGYFVTHTLSALGFNIPKKKWAQLASEVMMKKFIKNKLKRFSNVHISVIREYIKKSGEGIYLVGLDSHVGYIIYINDEIKFVHSNYYQPEIGVMSENIEGWNPLNDSKYRVIGKLFSDEMIINWLTQKTYN